MSTIPRWQKGFGMVEVLVTFAIMSFALIGITKMVLLAQHTSSDNMLRTQALILAQDMVGRILANSANARACTLSDYHTKGAYGATLIADNTRCYGTGSSACTPIQVAQQDVREWKNLIQGTTDASGSFTITQGLPSGIGVVCCTDNLSGGSATNYTCPNTTGAPVVAQYAVKVHWTSADGAAHRVVLSAVP
jgi:type IV pilus modification protein PilV